jgi:hypothetical protein
MSELFSLQRSFTEHLRDPDHTPVPDGLDKRRMSVYSELIFNNVSVLLTDFFPVIKSILSGDHWDQMVRNFFISHQSQTPYFMEISGEFVEYLSHAQLSSNFPEFLTELAHYEWVELALYTLDEEIPALKIDQDALGESPLTLSPLALPLAYNFPVHTIGPDFQPSSIDNNPTYLLVSRGADESVHFFELQALSFQLLHAIEQKPGLIANEWLDQTADQLGIKGAKQFRRNGLELLASFNDQRLLETR